MEHKNHLVTLEGLSTFLGKIKAWIEPLLSALNTKIDKKVWTGTKAELDVAIAEGQIDEKTLVIITDDDGDEPIYQVATHEDIVAMFNKNK